MSTWLWDSTVILCVALRSKPIAPSVFAAGIFAFGVSFFTSTSSQCGMMPGEHASIYFAMFGLVYRSLSCRSVVSLRCMSDSNSICCSLTFLFEFFILLIRNTVV